MEREIGIYIHIPFCKAKCLYCDFNSYAGYEDKFFAYFKALKKEIESYFDRLKEKIVSSIFIGGGTPSYVDSKYIADVLNFIRDNVKIQEEAEITIETNPGTLDLNKLTQYKECGINRISLGLQAMQNEHLKSLGRIHTKEEFLKNYELVKSVGFDNINIDLMFGILNQTLDHWIETLNEVISLKPKHISCYSLKIEDSTVFGDMYRKGTLLDFDEELDRDMYYLAISSLVDNRELRDERFKHYEISNFCIGGFECRHNLIYWNAKNYVGFGPGAHSYLGNIRFNNVYNLNDYINNTNRNQSIIENVIEINNQEAIEEYIILGLRLIDGISISHFNNIFKCDFYKHFGEKVEKLVKLNLLEIYNNNIRLTRLGLDLSNKVFVEFIL